MHHAVLYPFVKSLYFGVRGFGHLNLNVGEDDLFVQQISDGSNVGVVLSRNASCVEKCWGGWSWWIDLQKSAATTRRFYSPRAKCFVETELVSRAVFFISVAAAVIAIVVGLGNLMQRSFFADNGQEIVPDTIGEQITTPSVALSQEAANASEKQLSDSIPHAELPPTEKVTTK